MSGENLRQHQSFLDEFPPGSAAIRKVIGRMRSLPLYLEPGGFRAVHACRDEGRIAKLDAASDSGVLSEAQLMEGDARLTFRKVKGHGG